MITHYSTGPLIHTTLAGTYAPRWISQVYSADLDGDGLDDLLVLGASYPMGGSPVAQPGLVAFGVGDGDFAVASPSVFPLAALKTVHPREVMFADFNADGFLDVFVASHGYDAPPFPGEQNLLFLSNGNGTWRDATATLPQLSDFSHSACVGDVNGDGALDIVVGNMSPGPGPYVLLNDGNGGFTRRDDLLPVGPGGLLDARYQRLTSVQLCDLDADGRDDLVLGPAFSTASQPRPVQILWNTSNGGFVDAPATSMPLPAVSGSTHLAYDVATIDVNFDGLQDLIVAYQRDVALGGWELQVLENQGGRQFVEATDRYLPDPTIQAGPTPSAQLPESQYWVQFVRPLDVNADGLTDFVLDARGVTEAPDAMPFIYVHLPDGTFEAIRAGDMPDGRFDYSTQYAQWGDGGGFVHLGVVNSQAVLDTLPVSIEPYLPRSVEGGAGNDTLVGGPMDDLLQGMSGNDRVDGSSGVDTAIFAGPLHDYLISRTATRFAVTDSASGRDGVDTLIGIERLQFSDFRVNLTVQATAALLPAADLQRLEELYVAFFNRIPGADGLAYWIGKFQEGKTISDIADSFYLAGVQYSNLTGFSASMSDADFVNVVYRNVLGRPEGAAASGLAYWTGALADGTETRGSLVSRILDSAHSFKGDATYGWVADLLDNKIAVATRFAVDWGLNYRTPEAAIANGMSIAASVTSGGTDAAFALIGISPASFDIVA